MSHNALSVHQATTVRQRTLLNLQELVWLDIIAKVEPQIHTRHPVELAHSARIVLLHHQLCQLSKRHLCWCLTTPSGDCLDITVTTHQRKLTQRAKAMVTSVPVDLIVQQLVINLQFAQLELMNQILLYTKYTWQVLWSNWYVRCCRRLFTR